MKHLTMIVLALIMIMLGCVKCSDNNEPVANDIIPLAVGNTWNYIVNKDSAEFSLKWLITEKKSMSVVLPDSTEMISDVFITRHIATSVDGTYHDTSYTGYYKDKDGIVLTTLSDSLNRAYYQHKILNNVEIDWFDSISPDNKDKKCKGSEKIKTAAGTFDCIKYSSVPRDYYYNSYYSKGVGLVSADMRPDRNWSCTLVSYKLK